MIVRLLTRILVTRHARRGHEIVTAPDLYSGSGRVHYYCNCGKEWVG